MKERTTNHDLEVIAGPCSINNELENELAGMYELADIRVRNARGVMQRGVWGTRVVGLKSRTNLVDDPNSMGVDYDHYFEVKENIIVIRDPLPENPPSSVRAGSQIVEDTGLLIATEIMLPHVQLPYYEAQIPKGKLLVWQPSVEGLGYPHITTGDFTRRNAWRHGVKNAKNLDIPLNIANDPVMYQGSSLERQWAGQASYAQNNDRVILIHRGVDSPDNGNWRSALVHEVARHAKRSVPGAKLYLDPSHSCGPKLRDKIVETTVEAMRMMDGNNWLYDGILIEAGDSVTDTAQHITHNELRCLLEDLAKFRKLREPEKVSKGGV